MAASETYKRCVAYKYYLLNVETSSYDTGAAAATTSATDDSAITRPKIFLKAGHLVELDEYSCIFSHGVCLLL